MEGKPQWEESVERARLASLKTFEGRIEMVLASWEQVSRLSKSGSGMLAKFAADAGIDYGTLRNARSACHWLLPHRIGHEIVTDLVKGIGSWSLVVEGKSNSERWKKGADFAAFLLTNDPPEGFTRWTVDALRVHLGRKPTNTGRVALDAIAGKTVSEDAVHAAAALDAVEKAGEEIDQITDPLTKSETALDGRIELRKHGGDDPSVIEVTREDMSFAPNITWEARSLIDKLHEVKDYLDLHGSEQIKDPDTGEMETRAELMLDALQAHKGEIDLAFSEVGVGASFDSLLQQ